MKDLFKIVGLGLVGVAGIYVACKKDKKVEKKEEPKKYKDNIEKYYDIGLTEEEKEQLWKEYQQERRNRK